MDDYVSGELYSAFEWDVNNESVRLEVDERMGDAKRIAKLLELKAMCRTHPYDPRKPRLLFSRLSGSIGVASCLCALQLILLVCYLKPSGLILCLL